MGWQVVNGSPSNGIGNSLSVTWGPTGPYSITAVQIDPITGCKSDPVTLNVSSVLPLSSSAITGQDSVCANTVTPYSSSALGDDYVWSISPSIAGSVASGQHSSSSTIQWNNYTGNAYVYVERVVWSKCK
ncbi:MAG: hypothetical protein R2852_07130 [Bacteroidia bacterium]